MLWVLGEAGGPLEQGKWPLIGMTHPRPHLFLGCGYPSGLGFSSHTALVTGVAGQVLQRSPREFNPIPTKGSQRPAGWAGTRFWEEAGPAVKVGKSLHPSLCSSEFSPVFCHSV